MYILSKQFSDKFTIKLFVIHYQKHLVLKYKLKL